LYTLVKSKFTNGSVSIQQALETYSKTFSRVFFSSLSSDAEILLSHKDELLSENLFIYIKDTFSMPEASWKRVLLQTILEAPVAFVYNLQLDRDIIYINRHTQKLKSVLEAPKIPISAGIYILTPEIFSVIDKETDIDKILLKQKSSILICSLLEWTPNGSV
jgi:hypothetical protein